MAAAGSLVGREKELALLERLLSRAASGSIAAGFLEGEAGLGKTGVAGELIDAARARRFKIFRGAAADIDRDRPFGAVSDAFDLRPDSPDETRASLGRLLLGPTDEDEALSDLRYRILAGLLGLVEAECRSGPALLVLEDVHWADPSTLLMVHRLLSRIENMSLALLCTYRPLPRPPELVQVLEEARVAGSTLVKLGPLGPESVAALVNRVVGAEPSPSLLQQASRAAGNPLFVLELMGSMLEEGAIEVRVGVAEVQDSALAPPLRVTILRRLSFLPPETLELLRMAAVLGSTFSLTDLATVSDKSIQRVASHLEPALTAGFVAADGPKLTFRHDLVRESIHEDLPQPVRAGLHLHAGRALAGTGAPPSQVAAHLVLGAEPGDQEAIDWIGRAASEAAARSPATAIELFQRALELRPAEETATRINVQLSRALLWAGRFTEALQLSNGLLHEHPTRSLEGVRYAVGRVLVYQGNVNDSIERVEEALTVAHVTDIERARLRADLALRLPLQGRLEAAEEAAAEALREADRLGDARVVSTALSGMALATGMRGNFSEALEIARRAGGHAGGLVEESVELLQPRFFLGFALLEADRLEEARNEFLETMQLAEKGGTPWALPLSHAALALARFLAGQWDDALADADTSLRLGRELGMDNWLLLSHSVRASILARRGDSSTASAAVDEGCALIARRGPAQLGLDRFLLAGATVLEMKGDALGALEHLDAARSFLEGLGFLGRRRELSPEIVRLALAEGRVELAASAGAALDDTSDPTPSVRGAVERCHGFLTNEPDAHLRALKHYRVSGRTLEQALACESAGIALAKAGRSEEGITLVKEAAGLFEGLGATQDVARVEKSLRDLGVRRGTKGHRRRPKTGWDSLTKTEETVAGLAAEGLTNPQIGVRLFISRRTVDTHLSHILQKLGITSRVELAGKVVERRSKASTS